ncbi:MAG TPA: superoxide dismutase, partial [Myxococcota bacterium]|nr:superoxide dismutase [Myxococcota bacterium]
MDRRTFLVGSASALSFLAARKAEAGSTKGKSPAAAPAPAPAAAAPAPAAAPNFTLPELPYKEDALAPVISALTMSIHYGKHHRAYV